MKYLDRREAGRRLSRLLGDYAGKPGVIVMALPRGGVPVADEIAEALWAPLDVILVRKLGIPWQKELAIGAIASDGTYILNADTVRYFGITEEALEEITREEMRELKRRERLYRGSRPAPTLNGRTVILVDDGLATGSTMQAAVASVLKQHPARVVVAVPVAARAACEAFNDPGDDPHHTVDCVCAMAEDSFYAVGQWYVDFQQTTDEEVCELLERAWKRSGTQSPNRSTGSEENAEDVK